MNKILKRAFINLVNDIGSNNMCRADLNTNLPALQALLIHNTSITEPHFILHLNHQLAVSSDIVMTLYEDKKRTTQDLVDFKLAVAMPMEKLAVIRYKQLSQAVLLAQSNYELQLQLIEFIFNHNYNYVNADNKLYSEVIHTSYKDRGWSASSTESTAKQYPTILKAKSDSGLKNPQVTDTFMHILLRLNRSYEDRAVSYRKLGPRTFNMVPNRIYWAQPIFNKEPDPFFDILFKTVFTEEDARNSFLDSLAHKFLYPAAVNLPSPIMVGCGGAGKTVVLLILVAIFGNKLVNIDAVLSEDSMKNSAPLLDPLITVFDEMTPIRQDSAGHTFLKSVIGQQSCRIRNLHQKEIQRPNHTWMIFVANPDENGASLVTPVPLKGDGFYGTDRRFSPTIVREKLIVTVVKSKPELLDFEKESGMENTTRSDKQALQYISHQCEKLISDEEMISAFLGGIITKYQKRNTIPTAVHNGDYKQLIQLSSNEALDVFWYLFRNLGNKNNFFSYSQAYDVYEAHCNNNRVDNRFRKKKKNFKLAIDIAFENYNGYLSAKWEFKKYNITKRIGKSTSVNGWGKVGGSDFKDTALVIANDYGKPTIDKDFISDFAPGDEKTFTELVDVGNSVIATTHIVDDFDPNDLF